MSAPTLKVQYKGWHDVRCGACGSLLYAVLRDGTWAHIALGSLVDEPSVKIRAHVWVSSKAGWEVLPDDGLPRFEEGLPDGWLEEHGENGG